MIGKATVIFKDSGLHRSLLFLFLGGGFPNGWKIAKKNQRKITKKQDLSRMENIPLDELFKLFVHECRIKNLANVTIKGYEFACNYFIDWIGRNITCNDVTRDLINKYVLHLKDKLVKPQAVTSYQFTLSLVIKYDCRGGYIKDNIAFTHLVEQEHIKEIY